MLKRGPRPVSPPTFSALHAKDVQVAGGMGTTTRMGVRPPSDRGKRVLDLAVAVPLMIATAPVLAIASVLVRVTMGRPVLWRHERPGRLGKPFTMYKIRTMRQPAVGEQWLKTDEVRLTRVGRLLRKTSIDELPSLWNVVRGDMSMVGPRPLLMEYLPRYTERQMNRMIVRPGVTGWAQVNGRQKIGLSKRIELDLWYIDHRSSRLDVKILWMTMLQAFTGRGVVSGQNPTSIDDLPLAKTDG